MKEKIKNFFFNKLPYRIIIQKTTVTQQLYKSSSKIQEGVIIEEPSYLNLPAGHFNLVIGKNVFFKRFCNILMFPNAELIIGDNVFFNNYCSINCLDNIEIGNNSIFGEGVRIYDHNHKYQYSNNKLIVERNEFTTSSIKIGSNCWIGSNVTILKGVVIGDNVIVGSNCLIYKSISANTIVKSNNSVSQTNANE